MRRYLAIHAGLKVEKSEKCHPTVVRTFQELMSWDEMPRGAIVATAHLKAVQRVRIDQGGRSDGYVEVTHPWGAVVRVDPFGDFSAGRYLWRLADIKRIDPPVPAKGSRGLWDWHEICFPRWKMGVVDLYQTLCERKRGPNDIVVYEEQITCPECRSRYRPSMALSAGISTARIGGT